MDSRTIWEIRGAYYHKHGEGNGTPLQYSCLENPVGGGAWWAAVHGNPLQCSCLENPRDGGAWWAAIYGVAQSRTRLKCLSSSSIINTPPLLLPTLHRLEAYVLHNLSRSPQPRCPLDLQTRSLHLPPSHPGPGIQVATSAGHSW